MATIQSVPGGQGTVLIDGRPVEFRNEEFGKQVCSVRVPKGAVPTAPLQLFAGRTAGQLDIDYDAGQNTIDVSKILKCRWISVEVEDLYGDTLCTALDKAKVLNYGWLEIKKDGRTISRGRLLEYAPGYGLYGSTADAAFPSVMSNGMPSAQAVRVFKDEIIFWGNKHKVEGSVSFPTRTWATGLVMPTTTTSDIIVRVALCGLLSEPVNMG